MTIHNPLEDTEIEARGKKWSEQGRGRGRGKDRTVSQTSTGQTRASLWGCRYTFVVTHLVWPFPSVWQHVKFEIVCFGAHHVTVSMRTNMSTATLSFFCLEWTRKFQWLQLSNWPVLIDTVASEKIPLLQFSNKNKFYNQQQSINNSNICLHDLLREDDRPLLESSFGGWGGWGTHKLFYLVQWIYAMDLDFHRVPCGNIYSDPFSLHH